MYELLGFTKHREELASAHTIYILWKNYEQAFGKIIKSIN